MLPYADVRAAIESKIESSSFDLRLYEKTVISHLEDGNYVGVILRIWTMTGCQLHMLMKLLKLCIFKWSQTQ